METCEDSLSMLRVIDSFLGGTLTAFLETHGQLSWMQIDSIIEAVTAFLEAH